MVTKSPMFGQIAMLFPLARPLSSSPLNITTDKASSCGRMNVNKKYLDYFLECTCKMQTTISEEITGVEYVLELVIPSFGEHVNV